jgi:hypothetical protein
MNIKKMILSTNTGLPTGNNVFGNGGGLDSGKPSLSRGNGLSQSLRFPNWIADMLGSLPDTLTDFNEPNVDLPDVPTTNFQPSEMAPSVQTETKQPDIPVQQTPTFDIQRPQEPEKETSESMETEIKENLQPKEEPIATAMETEILSDEMVLKQIPQEPTFEFEQKQVKPEGMYEGMPKLEAGTPK